MTIAKDFASKFAVAFVAIAMLFTLVAPAVNAQESTEDLQKTINDLLAQVAALQSQMGDEDDSSASSCESIPAPLTMGAQNASVTALQNRLIADGETIAAGATGYFGAQTKAALASWQAKNNVAPAAGYYGPLTMAAMDASCTPDTDGEDDGDDSSSDELQGEGTLDGTETDFDDASDSDLMEGDEDAEIGTLTLGADDGDIEVSRLSFVIVDDTTGTVNEADLWETFETISLWVDGDMIGEFEADDEDNYLNEDDGTFRISGLDLVVMEDEEVEIVVAATIMGSVDGSDTTDQADWSVDITDIRYFDADGVASDDDIDAQTDEVVIDIKEEGNDDDAEIKSNSDTPDATTLKVDEDDEDSDEFDVHVFDIDVDEDSSDLAFNDEAYVNVKVANPTGAATTSIGEVVESVYLTIDGETVEGDEVDGVDVDANINPGANNTTEYSFDFDGMELSAGEVYEATVSIVFKGQDGAYDNGVEVTTSVDGADWEVEGAAGDADVLDGTDTSETHTLATVVPEITDVTSEVDRNEAGDAGTISFEFTIGASDDDVELAIANNAAVNGTTDDVRFAVSPTSGGVYTTAITKVSGDATYGSGAWTIQDGDEATFVLDVTFASSSTAGTYRVNLDTIDGVEVDETSAGLSI